VEERDEILWVSDAASLPSRLLICDERGFARVIRRDEDGYYDLTGARPVTHAVMLAEEVLSGRCIRLSVTSVKLRLAMAVIQLFLENMELKRRTIPPPRDEAAAE